MNIFRIAIILMLPFLNACNTTGGTIGGLLPSPKYTKGTIDGGYYNSADNSFRIKIPHGEGTYEYKYMEINEDYKEQGAYLSFGPAAFDKSIYRLQITYKSHPDNQKYNLNSYSQKLLISYIDNLKNYYSTTPNNTYHGNLVINGNKSLYWEFKQQIPAGKFYNNKPTEFLHDVYAVDLEDAYLFIWVETPEETQLNPLHAGIPVIDFAQSFQLTPNKQVN